MDNVRVETDLYTLFTGDATITSLVGSNVVSAIAQQGQALPCLHIEYQPAPSDVSALDGTRAWTPLLYAVKAVGKGNDIVSLEPIADRVEALLNKRIVETSLCVMRYMRVQPLSDPFVAFGTNRYSQLGGVYRVAFSPKS